MPPYLNLIWLSLGKEPFAFLRSRCFPRRPSPTFNNADAIHAPAAQRVTMGSPVVWLGMASASLEEDYSLRNTQKQAGADF